MLYAMRIDPSVVQVLWIEDSAGRMCDGGWLQQRMYTDYYQSPSLPQRFLTALGVFHTLLNPLS